ncbi:MAG: peptide deformylase [Candidatus Gygaella obscura]|nr:peptide deformylase [Candidatus Gygaella obscura]
MKVLEIKKYPDKILRKTSEDILEISEKEIKLFDNMLSTMKHFYGIGLAAPQVGILKNIIVVDIGEGPIRLANPKVVSSSGSGMMKEGCLSVPGVDVEVERSYKLTVLALNDKGDNIQLKARGLLARVLLHEIDHLRGKTIVDYMQFFDKIKLNFNPKSKEK